jgi:flavodoxin
MSELKTLVVYSTLTGNTRAVAEAVAEGLGAGTALADVKAAPAPEGYDLVVSGFWVDKGRADAASLEYLGRIRDRKAAFFFTLGAYPDSPHADSVEKGAREGLEKGGNAVIGSFRCQGKVDPNLLEEMKRKLPPGHPHAQMTDERRALLDEAARHPDAEDLKRAREFGEELSRRAG